MCTGCPLLRSSQRALGLLPEGHTRIDTRAVWTETSFVTSSVGAQKWSSSFSFGAECHDLAPTPDPLQRDQAIDAPFGAGEVLLNDRER